MNKQLPISKGVFLLTVLILLSLIFGVGKTPTLVVEAADQSRMDEGQTCTTERLTTYADNTMPVPSACLDGFCKLVIYANDIAGAFGEGYSWEVYYYQWTAGNTWVGGPNWELAGFEFSDGYGENGNGVSEAVFRGGLYGDGYIRIMDDGAKENDPSLWTIESRGDAELTHASLTVCSIPGVVDRPNITSSRAIEMPAFCKDSLCMIFRFSFAEFGSFGPGLSLPVYYLQDSGTADWIGGPNVAISGVYYSEGAGENGDGAGMSTIFGGGETAEGGYAELLDDGAEWSDSQWSVYYSAASDLSGVSYWIAPMTCTKQAISAQYTNINTPAFCVDELCTIVRYTDAWFGAFGPGLSWSVNYKQNSMDNTWIGGPNLCFGGTCFSEGWGLNGDSNSEKIFDSGWTENEDYVILRDDSFTANEIGTGQWNVVFKNLTDLSDAAYYICSNTCNETILLVNKSFLPFMGH